MSDFQSARRENKKQQMQDTFRETEIYKYNEICAENTLERREDKLQIKHLQDDE